LDANQLSKTAGTELEASAPAESGTPIPGIVLTDGTHVSVGKQEVLLNDNDLGLRSMPKFWYCDDRESTWPYQAFARRGQ
jgi:hypothetical protein